MLGTERRAMAQPQTLMNLEHLEEQLQMLKWSVLRIGPIRSRSARKNGQRSVVRETAGLLGKTFPRGVIYERRLRKTWASRLRPLGL